MSETLIFDIKRYAINDGPGIRVVVFFKGCNLHCAWCHNPEGISGRPEKMYSPAKCIRCGTCVAVCPENALMLTVHGVTTDPGLCNLCGECAGVCPTKAIEMSGREMQISEIMEIIEKERPFFDQSGGGVTFSGGEPMVHPRFLIKLLEECGKRGIHRAVDTAGLVKTEFLLEVAAKTDLFLFDLKMMDQDLHEQWTGVKNDLILQNLKVLAESGSRIIIRIPLIGGVNDHEENIRQIAEYVAGLPGDRKEVHLLPYHPVAQNKYMKMGRPDDFEELSVPDRESQERCIPIFLEYGISATIGG